MSKPIQIRLGLPLLEPSFTTEELQELSDTLAEIEKHELQMFHMHQQARRRSNALQFGARVPEETSPTSATK